MNVTRAYLLMKEALEEINDPISFMKKRAEANGCVLNDLALVLSNDPNFLKSIAKDVLNRIKEK